MLTILGLLLLGIVLGAYEEVEDNPDIELDVFYKLGLSPLNNFYIVFIEII